MGKKIPKGLADSLEQGEEVLFMVKKRFAIEKPKWLVITDRRIIVFDEKVLGRYELKAVPYEKLEKIVYHGGVVGSQFYIVLESGEKLEMSWMDKDDSKKAITAVYNALREVSIEPPTLNKKKNLVSEDWTLHKPKELVARSARSTPTRTAEDRKDSGIELLRKLRELREAGIISEEEYEAKKQSILDKI